MVYIYCPYRYEGRRALALLVTTVTTYLKTRVVAGTSKAKEIQSHDPDSRTLGIIAIGFGILAVAISAGNFYYTVKYFSGPPRGLSQDQMSQLTSNLNHRVRDSLDFHSPRVNAEYREQMKENNKVLEAINEN